MQLLLILSCLIGATLSRSMPKPGHQGHEEPKVAIDGYVKGYYTFLGHQLPAFMDKAHTALSGIEIANEQTGIHTSYPHSGTIAETSLITSHHQAGISDESAALAHLQGGSFNYNSHELSSRGGLGVIGPDHIQLEPFEEKEAGGTYTSIGLDRNVYDRNRNSVNTGANYEGFSNLNKASFGGGTITQKEKQTILSYPKYYRTEQASNFNSGLNQVKGFTQNQNIGGTSFETSSLLGLANKEPGRAVIQKEVEQTVVENPISYISQLSYTGNRMYGNRELKDRDLHLVIRQPPILGQDKITWGFGGNSQMNRHPMEQRFGQTGKVVEKENVLIHSNVDGPNSFRINANSKVPFTNQNLYPSGSGNMGPINTGGSVVTQKEIKNMVITHPKLEVTGQAGYTNSFLDKNQGIVDHALLYDYGNGLDMNHLNDKKTTEERFVPYPNHNTQMDNTKTGVHIGNGYIDEAGHMAQSVIGNGYIDEAGHMAESVIGHKGSYLNAGGFEHDSSNCDLNHHHDTSGKIVWKAGQSVSSRHPIVEGNIRDVFTERRPHEGVGVQKESMGVQTNYGGKGQTEYPIQGINQNINSYGAGIGIASGKVHHGNGRIDFGRGATPQQIPNTFSQHETIGSGLNLNQQITNHDLYIGGAGSSIPSGIGPVGSTGAYTSQEGIEITGVDSSDSARIPIQNQYHDNTEYGVGQVNYPSISDLVGVEHLGVNGEITDQNRYIGQTSFETIPKISQMNTGGDLSSLDQTIISYPNYGRIDKIGTGSGVHGVIVNRHQDQASHALFPGNDANGKFSIHGINTEYHPWSDSNGRLVLQNGLYGLTNKFPFWTTLKYPFGPNGHYLSQSELNGRYPLQDGVSGQYAIQGDSLQSGLNGRYYPQGGINVQFPLQKGFPQYPPQGDLDVQYSLLYGQYGQSPTYNGKYLIPLLENQHPQDNQGLTGLSSRTKEDGSDNVGSIETVEPEVEVAVERTSGTETQVSDAKSDDDHVDSEAIPLEITVNTADASTDIKDTSEKDLPEIEVDGASTSNLRNDTVDIHILDEHHAMETAQPEEKKEIQIGIDSSGVDSNQGEGETHVLDVSNRFGMDEVSKPVDTSTSSEHNITEVETPNSSGSTLVLEGESGSDRHNEDNVLKEQGNVQTAEQITGEHSGIGMTSNHEQSGSEKVQLDARFSNALPANQHENGVITGHQRIFLSTDHGGKPSNHNGDLVEIGVIKQTNELGGLERTAEGSAGLSMYGGGGDLTHVLNIHHGKIDGHAGGEHGGLQVAGDGHGSGLGGVLGNIIGLSRSQNNGDSTHDIVLNSVLANENDKGLHGLVQIPAGGFDGVSINREVSYPNSGSGGVLGNIIGLSRSHNNGDSILDNGGVHVSVGGFDGLSTNKEVVHPSHGHGGLIGNIIGLARGKNNGVGTILDNGSDMGLGVSSWKEHEVRAKDGFHSGLNFGHSGGHDKHNRHGGFQITGSIDGPSINVHEAESGHHGHLRPILNLAKKLL